MDSSSEHQNQIDESQSRTTVKFKGEDLENVEKITYQGSKESTDGNIIRVVKTKAATALAFSSVISVNKFNNLWKKTKTSIEEQNYLTF